jgi:hypothetical protein
MRGPLLPVDPTIVQGIPTFVDATNGDYHLRAHSLGVDFAVALKNPDIDLDGNPGGITDLPQIPNLLGPADLGAYELQSAFACDTNADALFCDGFGP